MCGGDRRAPAGVGEVVLLERTDSLLGSGLVGGIVRKYAALPPRKNDRAWAGASFLASATGIACTGTSIPRASNAWLYDVAWIETVVRSCLLE